MRHLHRRQGDAQTSRTLLQSVIASNFAQDGDPSTGQTPSATSTNNFINFCAGQNVTDGSNSGRQNCNPAPIGLIPSTENLPSVKILSPRNGDILPSDSTFTVSLASNNFAGIFFTNPTQAYMTAPQQLDRQGNIMGHYHLVIEQLSSFNQTTPTTPAIFAFSKEIFNSPPTADVTNGLSAGSYRAFVSLHTTNHQPVMLPVSQHGSVNDAVYFTVEESAGIIGRRRSIQRRRQAQAAPVPPPPADGVVQYKVKRQDSPETSRDLLLSALATSFANDGTGGTPVAGQVSSLTSTNNYINFCAGFPDTPITNGQQVQSGSCNPAPLGMIVPRASIPSSKFLFPTFGTVWTENQPFAVSVIVNNFEGGFRTNSQTNYMAAPQQLTEEGTVRGYVVISIEQIPSFTSTEPTNPSRFTWFEALSVQGRGGGWSTIIDSGLPAGTYRLSTSLRAENHQPILASTSVGGATGDVVYFTVVGEGGAANGTETAFPSSVVIPDRTSSGVPRSTNGTAAGDTATSDGSSQVNVGAIAGGVVAGITTLCLAIFLVVFFLRKRKASRQHIHSNLEPHAFIPEERNMVYSGGGTASGMSYSGSGAAGMNYSATGSASMSHFAAGNTSMNGSVTGSAGRTFSGEGTATSPKTLGSPPPFTSPNTSSSPYSLVSPDTSRSRNSSTPISNSTSGQSRPNASTYVSEKRLPHVPRSPDRSSVTSAAPSYRTTA